MDVPDWSVCVPDFGTITVTSYPQRVNIHFITRSLERTIVADIISDGTVTFYGKSSRVRARSRYAVSSHIRQSCSHKAGVSPLLPHAFWTDIYDRAASALTVQGVLSE